MDSQLVVCMHLFIWLVSLLLFLRKCLYEAQAGLKLTILLPQSPHCLGHRHVSLCLASICSVSIAIQCCPTVKLKLQIVNMRFTFHLLLCNANFKCKYKSF